MIQIADWRQRECPACEGTGIHDPNGEVGHPEHPLDCRECNGSGVLVRSDGALEGAGQASLFAPVD